MRADTEQLAAADAAFGTDLYARLAGEGNLVFSPASIAAALCMALIGARGETAAEMAATLHLPSPDAAREAQRQLVGSIPDSDGFILRMVNMAWIQSGLPILEEYLDQPVTVERADFTREWEAARLAINAAVEDQTAGKITDLLAPGLLDGLTRLVLVNAVYLKAQWEHQFGEEDTRKEPFFCGHGGPSPREAGHLERSASKPVDMMHMSAALAAHQGDGFRAVLLPYVGGPLAMAIVLPDGPLSQFPLANLGGVAGVLQGLLAGRQVYQVDLRLPKFTTRTTASLNDTLKALGMARAFSQDTADFSGITTAEKLQISDVVHQAYIDVNEKGTEAAAATAVVMRTLAFIQRPHMEFTADRPFLFAVVETTTGLPLFLGQFTGP